MLLHGAADATGQKFLTRERLKGEKKKKVEIQILCVVKIDLY